MEEREFDSPAAWRHWLEDHHATAPKGIRLIFRKKSGGQVPISYAQALDEALCFGWIDGHTKKRDEFSWWRLFTPRRPRSLWSKRNREHIERLEREGKMHPAGRAAVAAAQADGRWEAAYDPPTTATVPEDFQAALDANPQAAHFFSTLNGTNRYAVLWRIQTARKAETRSRRIAQITAMLERGETFP